MTVTAQSVVDGLVARGVPRPAAIGMAGNIAVESGFNPGINEIAPLVPGSRGGFGLIQWTGPRRRQFEQYAGPNLTNLDTQLDFLVHELNTTEKRARDAIYAAQNPIEAARLVSERFLRPGIPHLDRRIQETQRIAGMPVGEPQAQSRRAPPQAPMEAPQTVPDGLFAQMVAEHAPKVQSIYDAFSQGQAMQAPVQMQAPQVAPIQAVQRDHISPYLGFFQKLAT